MGSVPALPSKKGARWKAGFPELGREELSVCDMDSDPQRQAEDVCGTRSVLACSHFSCSRGAAHVCSRFLWLKAAEAEENLPEVTDLVFIPSMASLDHRVAALFKRYVGTRRGAGRVTHEAERDVG